MCLKSREDHGYRVVGQLSYNEEYFLLTKKETLQMSPDFYGKISLLFLQCILSKT